MFEEHFMMCYTIAMGGGLQKLFQWGVTFATLMSGVRYAALVILHRDAL